MRSRSRTSAGSARSGRASNFFDVIFNISVGQHPDHRPVVRRSLRGRGLRHHGPHHAADPVRLVEALPADPLPLRRRRHRPRHPEEARARSTGSWLLAYARALLGSAADPHPQFPLHLSDRARPASRAGCSTSCSSGCRRRTRLPPPQTQDLPRPPVLSPTDFVIDVSEWGFADVVGKGIDEKHERPGALTARLTRRRDRRPPRQARADEHRYRELFAEISEKADVLALCGDLTNFGKTERGGDCWPRTCATARSRWSACSATTITNAASPRRWRASSTPPASPCSTSRRR